MLTAPYADYYARTLALSGTAPSRVDAATDGLQIRSVIEGRLRQVWQHYWWPETMRIEERAYREDYAAATVYEEGDEVYYPTTGKYYVATGDLFSGTVPTDTGWWAELTDMDPPEIGYTQTGKTAIGQVRSITALDPTGGERLRRLPFLLTGTGVRLLGQNVPRTAYLWFQLRPPELRGADFDAALTYAVGDRIYFASGSGANRGDFWECVTATSAGQSPATTAAKWSRVQLPRILIEAVAQGAAADLMRASGKFELAAGAEAMAERALFAEQGKQTAIQGQAVGAARSVLAQGLPVPVY